MLKCESILGSHIGRMVQDKTYLSHNCETLEILENLRSSISFFALKINYTFILVLRLRNICHLTTLSPSLFLNYTYKLISDLNGAHNNLFILVFCFNHLKLCRSFSDLFLCQWTERWNNKTLTIFSQTNHSVFPILTGRVPPKAISRAY